MKHGLMITIFLCILSQPCPINALTQNEAQALSVKKVQEAKQKIAELNATIKKHEDIIKNAKKAVADSDQGSWPYRYNNGHYYIAPELNIVDRATYDISGFQSQMPQLNKDIEYYQSPQFIKDNLTPTRR